LILASVRPEIAIVRHSPDLLQKSSSKIETLLIGCV